MNRNQAKENLITASDNLDIAYMALKRAQKLYENAIIEYNKYFDSLER